MDPPPGPERTAFAIVKVREECDFMETVVPLVWTPALQMRP